MLESHNQNMAVQQYCLRWNNHQPNFISVFSTLLHNETLVDVTLAAEGRQLQAHKVVLSACSSYFQSLFTTNPCQHPIVILKDVQYNDLKTMVDFMYYGEVNVSTEQLPQILKTAEMLKIKGLAEMPDSGSVTKSESKSVEHADPNQMGGGNESIWGNTESQQAQQYQQQQQQMVQIQQRCSTPPSKSMSPALRRKRFRKSESGSGSTDRQEQQLQQQLQQQQQNDHMQEHGGNSQVEDNDNNKILYFSHLNSTRVLSSSSTQLGAQSNSISQVNIRSVKDNNSTEMEPPQHDSSQESIDESSHQPNIMKTEMDVQGVTQTMPLDISGSISMTQAHQQHSSGQWTLVDTSNYPRFATTSSNAGLSIQQQQQQQQQHQHHGNTENHSLNTSTSSTSSNGNTSSNLTAGVQMYQTTSGNYPSQIISVNPNTMVNSYPQSLSTSTSPQASDTQIVQSVYSQNIKQSPSPTDENSSAVNVSSNATPTTPSSGPTKRKRSVNPQGDENFIRALDAVRFDGIGFCKAARLYGVNNRTLWLEYKKRGYPISRPSIKNRIKLEPNMSPTPKNDENTIENYDSVPATSMSMTSSAGGEGSTSGNPLMCPPHVMGFLDTRGHVDFSSAAALHPGPRQRYVDGTLNINPAAVNLQGLNFNPM